MLKLFQDEDKRRQVNINFDSIPTPGHKYNLQFSKRYIKNKIVLDIGCWTGQFEQLAHKLVKEMVAIDPKAEAIRLARKILPKVKFLTAHANKLPFPDAYFDTVVFFDVIEHLPKDTEQEALNEIRRVVKAGGYLILSTMNKHFLANLLDPAYFLIGHRHYSVKELAYFLKGSRFKMEHTSLTGGLKMLLFSLSSYICKYTIGFELFYTEKVQDFLLKEHMKKGFAFLYIRAKAVK